MTSKNVTCECGLAWRLTKQKTSFGIRDDDTFNCDCGRELIRWNGAHIWTGEVLPEQKTQSMPK